jgi:hypothetical protein
MRILGRTITPTSWAASRRCWLLDLFRAMRGQPPSLTCWLDTHPAVASSIKWQVTFQTSAYDIPDTAKTSWPNWSSA